MFSNSSQSAPVLEDNMGKSRFRAPKSYVAAHQDSGWSSARKGTWWKSTLRRTRDPCLAD